MEDFPVEGYPAENPPAEGSPVDGSPMGRRPDTRTIAPVDPFTGEPAYEASRRRGFGRLARRRVGPRPSGRWRNVAIGLGLILAILVGATGSLLYSTLNRGDGSSTKSASPIAGVGTASPSTTAHASDTSGPTAPPALEPSGTASAATITFRDLMLDSAAESTGTARTFSFSSDGPGSVSASVVTSAPMTILKICIQVNAGVQNCTTGATPKFFTVAPAGDHAQWTVTLIATDSGSTPVVEVAFVWRTNAPAITLSHGRFQGSPNPDSLRGFIATFKTRAAGSLDVSASWPPASADAVLSLTDVTSSPGTTVDQVHYSAVGTISPDYSYAVTAGKTYQLQLLNSSADSGRPDLTTTIAFP